MSASCYGEPMCSQNQYISADKSQNKTILHDTPPYIQQISNNKTNVEIHRKYAYVNQIKTAN